MKLNPEVTDQARRDLNQQMLEHLGEAALQTDFLDLQVNCLLLGDLRTLALEVTLPDGFKAHTTIDLLSGWVH